jgi:hypothetical protein
MGCSRFTKQVHTFLSLLGRILAGDSLDGGVLELGSEMMGDIASGGDVAAEDNGAKAVFEKTAQVRDEGGEFGIAFGSGKEVCSGDKGFQLAGLIIHGGSGFDVALGEFGTSAVIKAFVII